MRVCLSGRVSECRSSIARCIHSLTSRDRQTQTDRESRETAAVMQREREREREKEAEEKKKNKKKQRKKNGKQRPEKERQIMSILMSICVSDDARRRRLSLLLQRMRDALTCISRRGNERVIETKEHHRTEQNADARQQEMEKTKGNHVTHGSCTCISGSASRPGHPRGRTCRTRGRA